MLPRLTGNSSSEINNPTLTLTGVTSVARRGCLLSRICLLCSSLGRRSRGLCLLALYLCFSSGEAVSSWRARRQDWADSLPAPFLASSQLPPSHKQPTLLQGLLQGAACFSPPVLLCSGKQPSLFLFPHTNPFFPSWEDRQTDRVSIPCSHYCMNYLHPLLQCADRCTDSKK